MHQRRDVIRHAGDELLQHRRGARPVALSDGGFGSELDDLKTGFRVALGHSPPQKRDLLPARRILFEQPPHDDQAVLDAFAAELDVGDGEQQHRVVTGRFHGEIFRRGRDIAADDECAREVRFEIRVGQILAGCLA